MENQDASFLEKRRSFHQGLRRGSPGPPVVAGRWPCPASGLLPGSEPPVSCLHRRVADEIADPRASS
ncbi:hypothetical protein NDU88_000368 [Pleurodeles waltl]|uniref:Uncharacterized protein n=1 Tax=Pleurodeles waltl TaxID=8319 RepID=A0AAV7KTA1_PLEWA|nr:hypothetical protein NDU88_000368 [Pleurodeles waltl]